MKLTELTVRIRRHFPRSVRQNAVQLEGRTFKFYLGWTMDEADPYPGEHAMIPQDPTYPDDAPAWIASGDLQPA